MARVTPRLGNGPRFGTCSLLFHNIRQIFSLQPPFLMVLGLHTSFSHHSWPKKGKKSKKKNSLGRIVSECGLEEVGVCALKLGYLGGDAGREVISEVTS